MWLHTHLTSNLWLSIKNHSFQMKSMIFDWNLQFLIKIHSFNQILWVLVKIHIFQSNSAVVFFTKIRGFSHSCLRLQQGNIYVQTKDHLPRKVTPIFWMLILWSLAGKRAARFKRRLLTGFQWTKTEDVLFYDSKILRWLSGLPLEMQTFYLFISLVLYQTEFILLLFRIVEELSNTNL